MNNFIEENKKRNKRDQQKYSQKWRKTKNILSFFISRDKYLIRELIVNWILVFLPITIFLVVAFVPEKLGLNLINKKFEGTAKNLSIALGIGIFVTIGFVIIILSCILKGIWIAKKKKGIYWPESFRLSKKEKTLSKKEKKEEIKELKKYE